MSDKRTQIREAAEADLEVFIKLVAPYRVLGAVHKELIHWLTRSERLSHQLVLLPRDHMKSALMAYRVAWAIVKRPDVRILYISSTTNLAEKQLKMIKDILTCEKVRMYWPELVKLEETKREKWTSSEISVDHPKRKAEGVRDSTVFTGGLTTSLTGLHCDIAVLDDVVVMENAYTEEGRNRVSSQYSLLASIEGAESEEWVVGTRYHPKDLYNDLINMEEDSYDESGEQDSKRNVYEVFERQVESHGDGTGEFLWPRQQRTDGKYFGFNAEILAKKRAKYLDKSQYRAQYYNNPNDPDSQTIKVDLFQYYDKTFLTRGNGYWYFKGKKLNIFAAIDFAFSMNRKSDWTALVVVGIDSERNYYVLDVNRVKTDQMSEYYKLIYNAYIKWDFRKLRAEVNTAQEVIVNELKSNYIKPNGLVISIETTKPNKHEGSKEERLAAILEPRYKNLQMWHYQGGNCQTLEDELVLTKPPHDDCKDALANAVEMAQPPIVQHRKLIGGQVLPFNNKFGGISNR